MANERPANLFNGPLGEFLRHVLGGIVPLCFIGVIFYCIIASQPVVGRVNGSVLMDENGKPLKNAHVVLTTIYAEGEDSDLEAASDTEDTPDEAKAVEETTDEDGT